MGGDRNRERTSSQQTTLGQSTTGTPGTGWGTGVLQTINGQDYANQIMNFRPYEGDRYAPPTDLGTGNYVAQYGDLPTTFVPQQTATENPLQATQTYVPTNYEPGIAAGLEDAQTNRDAIAGATPGLFNFWTNIAQGGGQNPYLEDVISSIETDFGEQSARSAGQRALYAGAEGAFGGTPMQQNETWIADQEAQALGGITSNLRYQDFLNTQGLLTQAPGQLADIAALGTLGANQMLQYGNLQQQNLQEAAAVGDANAQILLNNLHQAQQLNDTNAINAANDAIARWNASYQAEEARVADLGAQAGTQQEIAQTNINNAREQYEAYINSVLGQIEGLSQLLGLSRVVPGATTSSRGTSTGTTDTTASATEGFGWDDFSGIISAIIGGVSSDRRVKKNLEHIRTDARGVRWYKFHYIWQEDDEPKYEGVIAQELWEIAPRFVINFNGLLMVNYFALATWRLGESLELEA